jgi:hypothetical protein
MKPKRKPRSSLDDLPRSARDFRRITSELERLWDDEQPSEPTPAPIDQPVTQEDR